MFYNSPLFHPLVPYLTHNSQVTVESLGARRATLQRGLKIKCIEILLRGPKPRELISDSGFETVQSTHGIASEAFRNTWTCHHSSTSTSVVLGIPLASFALVIQGSHQCCYYLSTPPAFKSGGCASGKEHSCGLLSRQSAHTCSLPK